MAGSLVAASPSLRGKANIKPSLMFDFKDNVGSHAGEQNDDLPGYVDITSAVNTLMLPELARYADEHIQIDFLKVLPYADSSVKANLVSALCRFLDRYFSLGKPIANEEVLIANGVTSLLELLPFTLCDAGDGIMYPTPAYGMFKHNIECRNELRIFEVPIEDGFDQFSAANAEALVARFDEARRIAAESSSPIKALLISNPSNPQGRCYSRHTLIRLGQFCSQHGIHFVSDEIYALSIVQNPMSSTLNSFTSALSIRDAPLVLNENIHVLYGASKDFGLGGLRLGFLISSNSGVLEACKRIMVTASIGSLSAILFAQLLNDEAYMEFYIREYQLRLQAANQLTASILKENGIPFMEANAGLFFWIDLSKWLHPFTDDNFESTAEMRLTRWLLSRGVYIQPGEAFRSPSPGRFRLVYTSDPKTVALGLDRLIAALRDLGLNSQGRPANSLIIKASL